MLSSLAQFEEFQADGVVAQPKMKMVPGWFPGQILSAAAAILFRVHPDGDLKFYYTKVAENKYHECEYRKLLFRRQTKVYFVSER